VVSQTLSHHSLVFGAHLAKVVAAVDLLLITDHIKDQIADEADEDTSFLPRFPRREPTIGVIQQGWSLFIDYLWIVEKETKIHADVMKRVAWLVACIYKINIKVERCMGRHGF
jgi:hypothetical protein